MKNSGPEEDAQPDKCKMCVSWELEEEWICKSRYVDSSGIQTRLGQAVVLRLCRVVCFTIRMSRILLADSEGRTAS